MALTAATTEFLKYLGRHPSVRDQIKAPKGKTLLYAGNSAFALGARFGYESPIWREIAWLKKHDAQYADKRILLDVLEKVPAPDTGYRSLLKYVQDTERAIEATAPKGSKDYLVLWRALSGIFASNAEGPVSFSLGTKSGLPEKVFASTEVWVLLRNPKVDALTRDLLEYYKGCLARGQTDINFGMIRA